MLRPQNVRFLHSIQRSMSRIFTPNRCLLARITWQGLMEARDGFYVYLKGNRKKKWRCSENVSVHLCMMHFCYACMCFFVVLVTLYASKLDLFFLFWIEFFLCFLPKKKKSICSSIREHKLFVALIILDLSYPYCETWIADILSCVGADVQPLAVALVYSC